VVTVSLTISAVVDTANAIVGAVMVCRRVGAPPDAPDWSPDWSKEDVAERSVKADADKDIKDAQSQQAQRMEVLGQLAGGVAHDFNNLLGVILNYAAFVSEELTSTAEPGPEWDRRREGAQRDVGQIQRAAERATELTRQLLAFARREVVQARVLNLNEGVTAVEELLRRTVGTDMELITSLPGNLWPILADPGQIEQVLVNLAINARDAMPGGGTLRIDTANIVVDAESVAGGSPARPGRHVRLRVSDSGTGMSADVVSHAFEPFFTTKGDGSGTGLGLATVYGIVTQAEATIGIQSEPGAGTTFTIMFPVTDDTTAELVEPASFQRTSQGETILVVEDEEALREVTERIFTRHGYLVVTAANGPEAIALAERHEGEIHLLVTDVVMPKMLGKEVAERIREIRPTIKVLYMSGYAQPVLASQGRLEPGVALVDKPFSAAALLAKAGLVLNGHFRGYEGPS
jgi:signal transduction histidine kinase/CheY-like chemotaxis protein